MPSVAERVERILGLDDPPPPQGLDSSQVSVGATDFGMQ